MTLTFDLSRVFPVNRETAIREALQFCAQVGAASRSPVGWLIAPERHRSGIWHAHVLLIGAADDISGPVAMWKQRNGRVDVRRVADAAGVVSYTTKSAALAGDVIVSDTLNRYMGSLKDAATVALQPSELAMRQEHHEPPTETSRKRGPKRMTDRLPNFERGSQARPQGIRQANTLAAESGPGPAGDLAIVMLPVDQIGPNDYNPNVLTADQFSELVTEIRRLGHPAKPAIVRRRADTHKIVDGEHNWRAACEAGLREIPCEIIEVDDFEAKRQTYKRNQHGRHNPVALGRMFQSMMEERGLSQREWA